MVDSFFVNPAKSARKRKAGKTHAPSKPRKVSRNSSSARERDEEITSESGSSAESEDEIEESESDHETEADKRRRLAKEYLKDLENTLVDENAFDAHDLDRDIINRRLRQDVAEDKGKIFRYLSEIQTTHVANVRSKVRHITAVAATWPFAYTVSKDMHLQKWKISTATPVLIKTVKIGRRSAPVDQGHCGEILCVASSPNSRYVVTGGRDHRIVVWSAENLQFIKTFEIRDRLGVVLCMTFRRNSSHLYVGCADLRVRTYDLDQLAHVEILYGHQDEVVAISALSQERCVSVGARDRTAILWKIPDESRLTFRGGDTKLLHTEGDKNDVILEGSIDCCAMIDNQFFVTGSDNGNVCLWSLQRKKPVCIYPCAHGLDPSLSPSQASAEQDTKLVEIPPQLPRHITSICAVPYANVFLTGSWSGTVNMWRITDDMRSVELVKEVKVGSGIVTGLAVAEQSQKTKDFVIVATLSREHRLGRWLKVSGHDAIASFVVKVD